MHSGIELLGPGSEFFALINFFDLIYIRNFLQPNFVVKVHIAMI